MWPRFLVRFLILALIPILLITQPHVAQAAPVYGPAASATFTNDQWADVGATTNCEVVGYFAGSADFPPTIHGDLACSTGFNVSSSVVAFSADGGSCSFTFGAEQVDGKGTLGFVLPAGSGYDAASCVVTELCWSITDTGHTNPWDEYEATGCVPWALGTPPGETTSAECAAYTLATPVVEEYAMPGWEADSFYWGMRIDVPVTWKAEHPESDRKVYIQPIWEHVDWYGAGIYQRGWPGGTNDFREASQTGPGTGIWRAAVDWINQSSYGARSSITVVGVQVVTMMNGQAPIPGQGFGQTFGDDLGTTVVSNCWFYFGEKVADIGGTDIDEPAGPLDPGEGGNPGTAEPPETDPPAPADPGGCEGFSISDPASWAGAGICMVVKLLSWILDVLQDVVGALGDMARAIANLVADLIDQLLDLLMTLFVPTVAISDRLDTIRANFDNKAPFTWLAALAAVPATIPGGGMGVATLDAAASPDEWSAPSAPSAAAVAAEVSDSGCPDWRIKIGDLVDENLVCGSSFTNSVVGLRPVLLGMMLLLALWPLIRGTYYGSIPIINTKMGRD